MTQTLSPHIGTVGTSTPARSTIDQAVNVSERDVTALAAGLLKQARATSRTLDNAWMSAEMQSRLHEAAVSLARQIACRGGAGMVSLAVFSDEEDGQGELVADCGLTKRRVKVIVRTEDTRAQIVQATANFVHRSDWQRKPYDLSDVASWLLRGNA